MRRNWRDPKRVRRFGDDEEDRQEVDEPERAEGLPERLKIKRYGARRPIFVDEQGCLYGELDRRPQEIEIAEVQDLAIEIRTPVAIDHVRDEKSGDQEEVGHAERPSEGDDMVQPSFAAGSLFDAQRRMHHDDENDAEALGVIDPGDALPACWAGCGRRACDIGSHLAKYTVQFLRAD